ncbi:hypothetical protein JRO89_XS11G0207000 [Xanthoceras sorbifolium]|uniref:Glycosyltransferase n=1 Tax=Xanthoceras sorbifolium TaxID=99658 RepID=A0ABQ8HGE9_9ROSI|nr:hypothetical protein JRO89_XS11G0207000 [Xanthoceras sorbifolium]
MLETKRLIASTEMYTSGSIYGKARQAHTHPPAFPLNTHPHLLCAFQSRRHRPIHLPTPKSPLPFPPSPSTASPPSPSLPPPKTTTKPSLFELLRLNNPNVDHQALTTISENHTILGLVIDFFCTYVLSVASELKLPAYFFFTSGARCLALLLYFTTLHENTTRSFKDIKTLFDVPGAPSILSTDMPKPLLERDDEAFGLFSVDQLKEIAVGLEKSGRRFLWVVRNPPSNENQSVAISAQPDPDLDSLLPNGFLDRTKERGLVVKNWAPRVDVLNHDSVGGFMIHCGWNSVFEAVCTGIPMVAWPLYAEQRFNRAMMVEEIKIALPMVESENEFVSSTEVEKRVRELMDLDAEEGYLIRKQTIAMRNEAKAALGESGSSHVALTDLFNSWKWK